jgi:DNA-binding SARP family transcriptional activator
MCSRAPSTTSSSVSPRMTCPHSHVICFATTASFRRVPAVVRRRRWGYLGAGLAQTRIQLCGRFALTVDGRRVEDRLPGRQGRLLLAFLAANRDRTLTREDAVEALWADGRDGGLAPLLSKVRRVVELDGLRLVADWVDVEAAHASLHRAESALLQGEPQRAWAPAQVAMFVSGRRFLAGEEAAWIDAERRILEGLHVRALEAYAGATLGVGGTELAAAVRAGRRLVEREPYRESGYRILMEALDREGNCAEALLVYEQLRAKLRDDLGISPSPATQAVHRRLLG